MRTLKEIKQRFDSWTSLREQEEVNGTGKPTQKASQADNRQLRDIWLPNTLSDQLDNIVSKVSRVMNYDVGMAMAFAVSILEDNNAHKMAAEVNKLLLKMAEEE